MTTAAPSAVGAGTANAGSFRVLPGFVDAHLHIEAWLRSQLAIPLAGGRLDSRALAEALSDGPPHGEWLVLFGLDHTQPLQECLAVVAAERKVPVLVMHRTGHAAVLNSAGSRLLGLGEESRVVFQPRGLWSRVTGRPPASVRSRLLSRLRASLLAQGVVGLIDATPYRRKDEERVAQLRDALAPLEAEFMGDPLDPVPGCSYLKVVDPRSLGDLLEIKPDLREASVAVHAVEPEEILMTLHAAPLARLRVEHASLCPPAIAGQLAERGAVVCANPGFLIDRYEAFAPLRASGEAEYLHPVASLLEAGCRVVLGSDAPVSQPGVARSIEAVTERGSPRLPMAGAPVPLTTAFELACGTGSIRGPGSRRPTGTFVVVDTTPADGSGRPYTVVQTVIGGQVRWPHEPGRALQSPDRP
jgi:predicted amidohydrolase YtcJ